MISCVNSNIFIYEETKSKIKKFQSNKYMTRHILIITVYFYII